MRLGSVVVLLVALVFGGAAAFLARGYLQSAVTQKAAVPEKRRVVVVATQPLTFGVPLTNENTREVPWPETSSIEGVFTSKAQLLNDGRRVALAPIHRNEPIQTTKVTGPGQRASLSTLLDPGMRAVAVRVDETRGVAGFVLPGDHVDLVLTREGGGQAFTDILLQNVKVLAINQLANENHEKPTVAKVVTFELNTQQAQKVILAEGVGRVSLILRQAGQSGSEQARRVTVADLAVPEAVDQTVDEAQEARAQLLRLEQKMEEARKAAEAAALEALQKRAAELAELEARLKGEFARTGKGPAPAGPALASGPAPRDPMITINVVRNGTRSEQYSVLPEEGRRFPAPGEELPRQPDGGSSELDRGSTRAKVSVVRQ